MDAVFFKRRFAFEPDDGLMQKDVIEHRAEDIAAGRRGDGFFDRLGDGAAQRTARTGMFL